jgi:hypothetical protein
MRWPLKTRVGDNGNKEENCSFTGDPRPDFLCIGAQKGGTTWLYRQCKSHPDFWMPPTKELRYFDTLSRAKEASPWRCKDDRDRYFSESIKSLSTGRHIDLERYGELFRPKGSLLSGDISPSYSGVKDEIIQQVVSYFPNLKVIFLARDPVERAWSHLSMDVRIGIVNPFDVSDIEKVISNLTKPGLLLLSYPSKIVARWKRYVRPDLFRIYFFDDLERNPTELRRAILQFLGANPDKSSGRRGANYNSDADKKKLRLTGKVRASIAQFFKDELQACAAELGGPARTWPARYGSLLLCFLTQLIDDFDLLFWCDWLA